MGDHVIPETLSHLQRGEILETIAGLANNPAIQKQGKKRYNDPKSIFGRAVELFTNRKSSNEERLYFHSLWTDANKENTSDAGKNAVKKEKKELRKKKKRQIDHIVKHLEAQAKNALSTQSTSQNELPGHACHVILDYNHNENLEGPQQKRKVDSPHKSAGLLKKIRDNIKKKVQFASCFDLPVHDSEGDEYRPHTLDANATCIPNAPHNEMNNNEQQFITQDHEVQQIINHYNTRIMSFPCYTCPVCLRVVYQNKHAIRNITFDAKIIQHLRSMGFDNFNEGEVLTVCRRCCDIFKRNKIPSQAYFNNMILPESPSIMKEITDIEARLISQVKPFMKIFYLSKGQGQLAMKGSCIHFPQSVEYVSETLPISPSAADVLIVNESTEKAKTSSQFQVRPRLLYDALRTLKEINPLYANVQIQQLFNLEIPEMVPEMLGINQNVCIQASGFKQITEQGICILRASGNQLSDKQLDNRALALCAAALSYTNVQDPNTWTSAELDNINETGSQLYSRIIPHEDHGIEMLQINADITWFMQVTCSVAVCNHSVNGYLNKTPGAQLYRLKTAITDFVSWSQQHAIISVNGFHLAMSKMDNHIFLYDCYPRGPKGKKTTKTSGMSCLIKVPVECSPEYISEHVHRSCQPSFSFKSDLPTEDKERFIFNIFAMATYVKNKNTDQLQQAPDETPGFVPVNETIDILRASFHQGSAHIFEIPGNQCAAMCVSAAAHATLRPVHTWTTHYVNNILIHGDTYYGEIHPTRGEFLDPGFVAGTIKCQGNYEVNIETAPHLSAHAFGYLDCVRNEGGNDRSISDCLSVFAFSDYQAAIFTSRGSCLLLLKQNGSFYIFDSHPRNNEGLYAQNGTGCIIRFNTENAHLMAAVHLHTLFDEDQLPANLPLRQKNLYGFTITAIVCTPQPLSQDDLQDFTMEPNAEPNVSIQQTDHRSEIIHNKHNIIQDAPTHQYSLLLDCVIREDQPDMPELNRVMNNLRQGHDAIPEVEIVRQQGRPLFPGIEQKLEELSFIKALPHGKFGCNEPRKIPITPLDYFQQRLMSENQEFHSTDYLFYALSRVEAHTIQQKIAVCGNMVANDGHVNADENRLPGLENVHLYMGSIRGSGSYWKKYTADVLSTIEQLGVPTFFLTISYDDLNAEDSLTALWKAKHGKSAELPVNPHDIPYEQRKQLLNDHPIAAARHFNHRLNVIMDLLKNHGETIFGRKLVDFTYRVEFQGRGSPHLHALIYLENVPDWSTPEGITFLENNISCSLNVPYKSMVVRYQHHSHRATCFKNHKHCRFSFPRRPSEETKILDEEEIARSHGRFVDLKRSNDETMINNYHPKLLQILRCNMDIQAVTGTRAIAFYVGKYMSKGEPTYMKDEIRNIWNQVASDKSSMYRKAQQMATALIKQREISSQECAFRLLHLPLKNSSRATQWVPTYSKEKRVRLVKKDTLFSDEPQVGLNVIERYFLRPESLGHICLFEFAAWYKPKTNKNKESPEEDLIDGDVEPDDEEEDQEGAQTRLQLLNNKGYIVKRKKHAIVRYPRFKPLDQTDEYLYSMILLYYPMRDENFTTQYNNITDAFHILKTRFRNHADDDIINPNEVDKITAILNQLEEMPNRSVPEDQENDDYYNEINNMFYEEDGEPLRAEDIFVTPPADEHPSRPLQERANMLTKKQREVYDLVRNQIVNGGPPLRHFVSGCGGTGKSHLINILTELITTMCPGGHRSLIKASPTGVASRNVNGVTIHKAFSLGIESRKVAQYMKLGDRLLHERRLLFKDVLFILIDEVSMISYQVFRTIHLRLTEIYGKNLPFGNINIILFGDLLQLPPCLGNWIFEQPQYLNHEANLWRLFTYTELTEVKRQRNQDHFYHFIQRLRIGTVLRTDIDFLHQFKIDPLSRDYDHILERSRNSLHLYPTCKQVDEYNQQRIKEMEEGGEKVYQLNSYDTFANGPQFGLRVSEKYINKDIRKCAGIPTQLFLAVGAKVMLKWNIDPLGGLCNGSLGIVRHLIWTALRREQNQVGDLPQDVLVEFEGFVDNKHKCQVAGFENCTAVKAKTFEFDGNFRKKVHRKQIPLVLSFATSIHKSQGLSLDSATIYMGKKIFKTAQLYVAVSRLRSVDGLIITEIDEKRLLPNKAGTYPCNDKAFRELTRLNLLSFLECSEQEIENFDSLISWCIQYVNCRQCREYCCNCLCGNKI